MKPSCKVFTTLSIPLFVLLNAMMPVSAHADMAIARMAYAKKHYDIAIKEVQKHLSEPEGQFLMATIYADGAGVIANPRQAVKWYLKSANSGHIEAHYALGNLFFSGERMPRNYREALSWYKQGASLGHAGSRERYGAMLITGRGGQPDLIEGMAQLLAASKSGRDSANVLFKENEHKLTDKQKEAVHRRMNNLLHGAKQSN